MNIGEIIGDAVRYPLSDPKKLLIFGIIFVISYLYSNFLTPGAINTPLLVVLILLAIVAFVFTFGYEIRIIRATLAGLVELPEFDDPKDMFVDGLRVIIVGMVYSIPFFIFGFVFALIITLGALTNSSPTTGSVVVMGILIIVALLIGLLIFPLILMSLTNMVYNNSKIEAAFKFGEIFNKISNIGWGNFLVWYIVTGIIYLILLVIGLIIVGFFNLIHLKAVGGIIYPLIIVSYMSIFVYRSAALFFISGEYMAGDPELLESDNYNRNYELQDVEP